MDVASQLIEAAAGATYAYGPNDPRTIELNAAVQIFNKAKLASSEAIIAALQRGVSVEDTLVIGDAAAQSYIAKNGPGQGLSEATQNLVATNFQRQSDFLKDLGEAPISDFDAYNQALASDDEARRQQSFKDIVTDYVTALDIVETSIVTGDPLPIAQIVDDELVLPERVITVTPDIVQPTPTPPPIAPAVPQLPTPVSPLTPLTPIVTMPQPMPQGASNLALYGLGALALLLALRR